jgi:prepilin-type N-terminal cleavage/methylation domain-containing protein
VNTPIRSKSSAFSLLEILVSIAIVSILAVVLTSSLTALRKKAAMGKDLSNLRQIGLGVLGYAGDNDGRLPNLTAKNSGGTWVWPFWCDFIAPYLGMERTTEIDNKGNVTTIGVFRSPFVGDFHHSGASDYGANNFVIVDGADYPFSVRPAALMVQLSKPSKVILVANTVATGPWSAWPKGEFAWFFNGWDVGAGHQPRPYPIWGKTFNAVFADGSVRAVDYEDFQQNSASYVGGNAPLNDIRYAPQ